MKKLPTICRALFLAGLLIAICGKTARAQYEDGSLIGSIHDATGLDGLDNNAYGESNRGFDNQIIQPPPDSISQFQVVTNNESAE
jgi:hypothetical protein